MPSLRARISHTLLLALASLALTNALANEQPQNAFKAQTYSGPYHDAFQEKFTETMQAATGLKSGNAISTGVRRLQESGYSAALDQQEVLSPDECFALGKSPCVTDRPPRSSFFCLDLRSDVQSCGSCYNRCTDIPHVVSVECQNSGCAVLSCEPGFRPSAINASCVEVAQAGDLALSSR